MELDNGVYDLGGLQYEEYNELVFDVGDLVRTNGNEGDEEDEEDD